MPLTLAQVMPPVPEVNLLSFWIPFGIICLVVRAAIGIWQIIDKGTTDKPARAICTFYVLFGVAVIFHIVSLVRTIGFQSTVEILAKADVGTVLLFGAVCTAVRVDVHYFAKGRDNRFEQEPLSKFGRVVQELSDSLVYAGLLVFLIIRPFFIQTFIIPSPSMVPTLIEGDILIVDKFSYRFLKEPEVGEVVVFKPPDPAREMAQQPPGTDFVKRLIGGPGDVIEIRDTKLFRNGIAVAEPYVQDPPIAPEGDTADFKLVNYEGRIVPIRRIVDFAGRHITHIDPTYGIPLAKTDELWELEAVPLPSNQYLMVGDNRTQSYDGRYWGPIPRHQIVGKAWWRIFPLKRFGHADSRK